ncbi:MAG: gfo/Idh/MocA family oxidoreductase, partial [Nonomuraea sp.]|nr:gfo/Idh/MocA family oxidoreductase [Nonomuraea sp.]
MRIGILSFAHLHATEYVAALRRSGDVEIMAYDTARPEAET